jgi:O-antigen/teichoic acid export membrane protein
MNGATSLRDSAKRAMTWSAGVSIARDVLQFGQMLVLARLLDPTMYGAAAMTATLIGFIGIPSFQHVIAHVLQVRGGEVNYHQHFTAGLVINGALFLIANVVAIVLGTTDVYAPLQPLLHLSSVTFLLGVPAELRIKMLEREHQWERLRNLQLSAILVSIAGGIGLALAGAGVYALIVPGLLGTAVIAFDLLAIMRWRPVLQWNRASYADSIQFGLNRAASNTLNGGRALLQNSLITHHGQFFGLGLFSRAEGLANMFCARVSQQAAGALYPIVTRAEAQSAQFQRITGLAMRAVAWVVIPVAAFISLEAEPLIAIMYGHQWDAVAPLVPLAMASGVAVSLGATAYSFLMANNQSRLCLRIDMGAFALAASAMVVLIPLGIKPYLGGAAISNSLTATVLIGTLVATHGIGIRSLFDGLAPSTLAALVAGTLVYALKSAAMPGGTAVSLVLSWASFTAVYVLVLRLLFKAPLVEIVGFLPGGTAMGRLLRL